ncbi:amino acid racemase [Rhizobium sp. VS19-DR104.2]|uniref:aspartate/glutamate racemase family protein n=1 Tax=unclassified Rhizobium TaxID=2613769 RepID=UPI001CC39359|nr:MULTISPECIES: amino acid racemase [unclassified Rhizobium]MBZ5763785.1 amino acid racemase [Rhizobium sp. VS19-DR96]MBZ5769721.1 amino acid racemase [Rhizobium sp. VS19-DR129.2]MBZ5777267.1 amino acid racemase [Rhizobium sp. VS19-DRK62.2]MBZ5788391.1 amino acid racemase [Rhizobium sp. VS19-DR121]MBZ5805839.1 amino acid racemase [Rhizobium sp. VS19-DR181]
MIGILGGMGPLATADLFEKLIRATAAANDQENLPIIISSDPRIPDRQAAFFEPTTAPSPLPLMIKGITMLEAGGARCIIIACNTAHHWFDALQAATSLPLLHIANSVCSEIQSMTTMPRNVGLLGTLATIKSGFYQARLNLLGLECTTLTQSETEASFNRAIAFVKQGDIAAALPFAVAALECIAAKGVDLAVLGCTELPIALASANAPIPVLDPAGALARSAVRWMREFPGPPEISRANVV